MTREDFEQIESSQRQHDNVMYNQEKMNIIVEQSEYNLFNILRPKLYIDRNRWCCLFGDEINGGIAGFGDSPYLAILEWNKSWLNEIDPTIL